MYGVCATSKCPERSIFFTEIGINHNGSLDTAKELTMTVHEHGQAVAGTYNFEIAEQKTTEALATARASGHPLQLKTRQVE